MKSISANLKAHLAGDVVTLATCWKVTRTDNQVFGFTDHDSDLVVGGVTYKAATGYTATAVQSSSDLAVDNLELAGGFDAAAITEADLLAGVWDDAAVEWFVVNYRAIGDGVLKIRKGKLGEVRVSGHQFVAELRGMAQRLQQVVGEVFTPSCRADLFDARCGLTAASYSVTGSVTSVTDRTTFRDSGRTEANDYFSGGKLTWTSGLNSGKSMEIKSHNGATDEFVLYLPMPFDIQVGDGYAMLPGCRKRLIEDCKTKFNNVLNFRGEPYVPGMDEWQRGAR